METSIRCEAGSCSVSEFDVLPPSDSKSELKRRLEEIHGVSFSKVPVEENRLLIVVCLQHQDSSTKKAQVN